MATAKNSDDDNQGRLTGTQSIERALLLFNRDFSYTLTPRLLGRDSVRVLTSVRYRAAMSPVIRSS